MNTSPKREIELPKIRRQSDSWEGQVIEYLLNHPSKKPVNELLMEAVSNYWLVEALAGKVSKEDLIKASLSTVGPLEGRLIIIRTLSGIQQFPSSHLTVVDRSLTSSCTEKRESEALVLDKSLPASEESLIEDNQQQDENDEDLGLLNLKLTDELKVATELLGFEQSNGKSL